MRSPTEYGYRLLHYRDRIKNRFDTAGRAMEAHYGVVSARYYRGFWNDAAGATGAEVEDIGDNFLRISRGRRRTYVTRHMVMLDSFVGRMITDNKILTHRILAEHGFRAPRHREFNRDTVEAAAAFLRDLGRPVVVKPRSGSGGRGITTNIDSEGALHKAVAWASSFEYSMIVEEQIDAPSYRLLFLDGRLIDSVRRESPSVTGDGYSTIRDLVEKENDERLRAQPVTSLMALKIDLECGRHLDRQGLSPASTPGSGEQVELKSVVNQNAARENHLVRDHVHPSFEALGRAFGSVLDLRFFGMDVMADRLDLPLDVTGGVINELNVEPGLHYHDLVSEPSLRVPVGAQILTAIFDGPPPPQD
ncbi:MAG: cyanophycin synthetase [Acidimicrobiia bacterium]|nr:cyanophycin synthetase [Acidimicrobiia bacterium]